MTTLAELMTTLPRRLGPRPRTGPIVPHEQLDQNGLPTIGEKLWQRRIGFPGVVAGPSGISAPATRAVHLEPKLARGPSSAFVVGTEFAHIHGAHDGSLHAALPPEAVAPLLVDLGWGELHPIARTGARPPTLVMLYGPRDEEELEAIWKLVELSYQYARGELVESRDPRSSRSASA